mgnify:CR=1 FL=1
MENTLKTMLLMAALTVLFVAVGWFIGGNAGMLYAFLFAVVMNIGAWWFSDTLALTMNRAQEVSPEEAPELHRLAEELAEEAGMPKPRVYMVQSDAPNAFATGRDPAHSAVAVTTGILRLLNREELRGVLAHEMAHIKHRDTLIASIAAILAGAIMILANMGQWSLFYGGVRSRRRDESGIEALLGLLLIILAPLAALLIQMAISRSREFSADEGGARIAGNPLGLASALEKLEWWASSHQPMQVNPATAHLFIVNPLRGAGGFAELFRTHPNTGERIRRLQALAGY